MLASLFLPVVLLLSPFFAFASPIVPPPSSYKSYYPWKAVSWAIAPKTITSDTTITLSWKGGSGNGYDVYFIPQWPGQADYKAVEIAATSMTSVKWHTPKFSEYPEGTTFILAVNDVTEGHAAEWYDLSGLLPFVKNKQKGKQ